jgi:uncharacterized protein YndB with AHSA1/START domain
MKPVAATVTVPQPRERVYDFLDVLSNHEQFTDHFLVDWELSGPDAGVGARAHVRVKSPGPDDWLDMTVISGERPHTTTEESIGAKGKRRTRGTYTLEELPDGGTRITFELVWLEAPLPERLAAPITRSVVGRANARALRRLVDVLADNAKEEAR